MSDGFRVPAVGDVLEVLIQGHWLRARVTTAPVYGPGDQSSGIFVMVLEGAGNWGAGALVVAPPWSTAARWRWPSGEDGR